MGNIREYWPLIVTIVGVTAWLVRIESKVLYLEKDLKRFFTKSHETSKEIKEITKSLARIEGKLEIIKQEKR